MVSPIINNMSIPKQEYYDLKEYWDYQRKLEYNKEVLRNSIESAIVLNGEMENVELPFNHDELFEMMFRLLGHDCHHNLMQQNYLPHHDMPEKK